MIKLQQSVVINQPVEEVFSYVTDIDKHSMWAGEIVEAWKTSEGSMGVGTMWTGIIKALGRKMENTHEITEYERNRKFSMKVTSGPVAGKATYSFEPVADRTRVTIDAGADLAGFFKLADPIVHRTMQRQYETNLANLKDLLETQV